MARAIAAGELTKIRGENQLTKLYLSIPYSSTVLKGSVSVDPTVVGGSIAEIHYTNISGAAANVVPDMTVMVTNSLDEIKGWCRVRKAPTSSVLYIGEMAAGEIDWTVGDRIHVLDAFHIFPKHIRIVSPADFRQDWDIAYTDQHSALDPVVNMGPDAVAWLVAGSAAVSFDASGSFVLGGSVASYAWTSTGGVISNAGIANPTITFNAVGVYRVACTVTSAAGKAFTGYRYVHVYSSASLPITEVEIGSLQGSYDSGGWSASITAYGQVAISSVRDRSKVILFARDWYQGVEGSLGPIAGRENVIFEGWIIGSTISKNIDAGSVEFRVAGPNYWMGLCDSFPCGVEDTDFSDNGGGAANRWTEMSDLTADKGIWHLLHWRSTWTRFNDTYLTGDTKQAATVEAPDSKLWSQLLTMAESTILARPVCDRYGRLFVQIEPNYVPLTTRDSWPVVMDLEDNQMERLDITWRQIPGYARAQVSGVAYTNGAYAPVGAKSPGEVSAWVGLDEVDFPELIMGTQAQAIELAGLVAGSLAGEIEDADFELLQNNRFIDIVPYQFLRDSLAAPDTVREVVVTNARLLPRNVAFEYLPEAGQLLCYGDCIGEGVQWGGVAMTFPGDGEPGEQPPTEPPAPPPPPIEPPPLPPEPGTVDAVVVTIDDVRVTADLDQASPTWTSVKGTISAPIDSDLSEADANVFYVLEAGKLWKTVNLTDVSPTFSTVLTAANYPELPGLEFARVRLAPGSSDLVYVLAISDGKGYMFRSASGGLTWTYAEITGATIGMTNFRVSIGANGGTTPANGGFTQFSVNGGGPYGSDPIKPWGVVLVCSGSNEYQPYHRPGGILDSQEPLAGTKNRGPVAFCNADLDGDTQVPLLEAFLDEYFGPQGTGWVRFITNWTSPMNESGLDPFDFYGANFSIASFYVTMYVFWYDPHPILPTGFDVARSNPQWLYVGTQDAIYRSQDGGFTWDELLADRGANDICVDPQLAGVIYVWDTNGDLILVINGVVTPPPLNAEATPIQTPLRIARDMNSGRLWAMPNGSTLSVRNLAVWTDQLTGLSGARGLHAYLGGKSIFVDGHNVYASNDYGVTTSAKKGAWDMSTGINAHRLP